MHPENREANLQRSQGQVFHPSMNTIARVTIFGTVFIVAAIFLVIFAIIRSPYATGVGMAQEQPVPFSHWHHVDQLGIECRYCHTSVEKAAYAGIPPTETCMSCHSQIWTEAPMLEPVRASYRTELPLEWNKVHDLADYAYFNHSIHVNKGFGCETCHGRVDQMPLMWKAETLHMEWCLDCHRNPEEYIRPVDEIYTFGWQPPAGVDRTAYGLELVEAYHINPENLDNCSKCHR